MQPARPLRAADVLRDWIPLALSWLLMAVEDPFVVGAVTKLPDSTALRGTADFRSRWPF